MAGLHSTAVTTGTGVTFDSISFLIEPDFLAELSSRFKEDGMLAYVELIQRKEKEIDCDVLTHQKWSFCFHTKHPIITDNVFFHL